MPSRRRVTGTILCAAGLWAGRTFAAQDPAADGAKASKASVRYQDQPKGIQSCAICSLFLKPDGCKVVEGKVSEDGWCSVFDLVD
jgi:High potential iron-sulfur protein